MWHLTRCFFSALLSVSLGIVFSTALCEQAIAVEAVEHAPEKKPSEAGPGHVSPWREALNCGPNALFVFLQCYEVEVGLADVRRQIPLTGKGCSFADLELGSEHFGLPAKTIKTDVSALGAGELPAVILLDKLDADFGHFVLVFEVDEKRVTVMDPVSTVVKRVELGGFQRAWTGYAMVPRRVTTAGMVLRFVRWVAIGCLVVFGIRMVVGPAKQYWPCRTRSKT